jgi:hypothetical protein
MKDIAEELRDSGVVSRAKVSPDLFVKYAVLRGLRLLGVLGSSYSKSLINYTKVYSSEP